MMILANLLPLKAVLSDLVYKVDMTCLRKEKKEKKKKKRKNMRMIAY